MKVIFHIDIDSYFVSAMRTIKPELKNKPIAISSGKKRSIVSALSYEAKQKGAKVPWPLFKIQKVCPNIVNVKPNYSLFAVLSSNLFDYFLKNYTSLVEVASIDECYIDVTKLLKNISSQELAKKMQKDILNKFDLPISIGISYNKFYAKMATGINKPFGITLINNKNVQKLLYPLEIETFWGIGKSNTKILKENDILQIGDLKLKSNQFFLENFFKKRWWKIKNHLLGNGSDKILLERNELKSIGNSITFMTSDLDERHDILQVLKELTLKVVTRLEKRNLKAQVLSIHVKNSNFIITSKQIKLKTGLNDFKSLFKIAIKLFDQLWDEKRLRLIGISINELKNIFEDNLQQDLFKTPKKDSKLSDIIDIVNHKMQSQVVTTLKIHKEKLKTKDAQSKYLEEDHVLKKN